MLDGLTRNDGIPSADLPPAVRDYLATTSLLPPFDPAAVAAAQALFARHGPEILVVLGFYSLPASYMAKKGAQVVYRTGYMAKRPLRRVFETVQMVIDVLSPGGLEPAGAGVRTAQKVRLMHAAVRHLLTHDPARPWEEDLGVPINQEDLAGTLMTFSCLVLEGLGRLGIDDHRRRAGRLPPHLDRRRPHPRRSRGAPARGRRRGPRAHRAHLPASGRGLTGGPAADGRPASTDTRQLIPLSDLTGSCRSLAHHFLDDEPITGRNISRLLGLADQGSRRSPRARRGRARGARYSLHWLEASASRRRRRSCGWTAAGRARRSTSPRTSPSAGGRGRRARRRRWRRRRSTLAALGNRISEIVKDVG